MLYFLRYVGSIAELLVLVPETNYITASSSRCVLQAQYLAYYQFVELFLHILYCMIFQSCSSIDLLMHDGSSH